MTTASTTASTATDNADDRDYLDLPRERPCHTHDLLQRLDTPLRRAIECGDVDATAIAYCARLRGVSWWSALALVEIALDVVPDDSAARREIVEAVRIGRARAEAHAAQTLDVEVTHASIRRAQHQGASWTARLYMRPIRPTAATPKETSYACVALDEHEQPTAELLALLDTFGVDGGPVLDLEREHVLVVHTENRLDGRRARAITRDDQRDTTHVLRFDGYR